MIFFSIYINVTKPRLEEQHSLVPICKISHYCYSIQGTWPRWRQHDKVYLGFRIQLFLRNYQRRRPWIQSSFGYCQRYSDLIISTRKKDTKSHLLMKVQYGPYTCSFNLVRKQNNCMPFSLINWPWSNPSTLIRSLAVRGQHLNGDSDLTFSSSSNLNSTAALSDKMISKDYDYRCQYNYFWGISISLFEVWHVIGVYCLVWVYAHQFTQTFRALKVRHISKRIQHDPACETQPKMWWRVSLMSVWGSVPHKMGNYYIIRGPRTGFD